MGYWIGSILGSFIMGYLIAAALDRVLMRRFLHDRSTAIAANVVCAYALVVLLKAAGSADSGPITLANVPVAPYAVGLMLIWTARLKRDKSNVARSS